MVGLCFKSVLFNLLPSYYIRLLSQDKSEDALTSLFYKLFFTWPKLKNYKIINFYAAKIGVKECCVEAPHILSNGAGEEARRKNS